MAFFCKGRGEDHARAPVPAGGRAPGEPRLCINFQENPSQLSESIGRLAGDAPTADALEVLYFSPVELRIDSIIGRLFRRIEEKGIRRVVLDTVGDLAAFTSEPHRVHDYLYALTQHLPRSQPSP